MSHQDEAEIKIQPDGETYKTIERVTANPTAKAYIDTAVDLYQKAKDSSNLVKYGMETAEATLAKSVQLIPAAVLESADALGVVGLDKLAEGKERLEVVYENVKKDVEGRILATDEYLKESVLSVPANAALGVGEAITNRVFPEKQEKKEGEEHKEGEDKAEREDGPLFRAGKLSYRVTEQTLAALRNMTLQTLPSDTVKSAHLVIDLMADAAHSLEAGARGVTADVSSRIPTKDDVTKSLQSASSDAVNRLSAALEIMSKTVTESPVTAKVLETPLVASVTESEFFQKNAERLREATKTLGEHVNKGDVPSFILESVMSVVTSVRDSLSQRSQEASKKSDAL